jgi:hypothetical protein
VRKEREFSLPAAPVLSRARSVLPFAGNIH